MGKYGIRFSRKSRKGKRAIKKLNAIDPALEEKVPSIAIIPLENKGESKDEFYSYSISSDLISDVSGAGDTFLATLVYSYVRTNDIDLSIETANEGATYVVQRKGVSCVDGSIIKKLTPA